MTVSSDLLDLVLKQQNDLLKRMREFPPEGVTVSYLGKNFHLFPTVFIPHEDSQPLIDNLKIKKGDRVLDLCTGSGAIAIFAAYLGASKVVAVDINRESIRAANLNVKTHGFEKVIEVRESDMYDAIGEDEKFDIVTANMPFLNKHAPDLAAKSVWDEDLYAHKRFFSKLSHHLKPNGKAYLSQANFGAINEVFEMCEQAGFSVKKVGSVPREGMPEIVFYGLELERIDK